MSLSEILENGKSGKKGRKPKIDEARLTKLVTQGKKDTEIALILGVSRRTVGMARKRLGLKENYSLDKKKLIALHKEGKTDSEIAEELGISRRTVGMARQRLDLKANKEKGRPAVKPKVEITPQIENDVLHLLEQGHSPREVAKKHEITRNDVIKIYLKNQPRTWPRIKNELNSMQEKIFLTWRERVDSIINKRVTLLEVECLKTQMKEIRVKIDQLTPEEKGCLPAPDVMARMGVRSASMVVLTQDAEYVGMRHMMNLLQHKIERKYWAEIRRGMENMDSETKLVAERYLEEEVYIPFFAAEFSSGVMPALVSNTSRYNEAVGINLDTAADEPERNQIEEIFTDAQNKSTAGTAHRRGRNGGKRKRMEEKCFWSN